jgi:hypothetical protein
MEPLQDHDASCGQQLKSALDKARGAGRHSGMRLAPCSEVEPSNGGNAWEPKNHDLITELLAEIRAMFSRSRVDRLSSEELVTHLNTCRNRSWSQKGTLTQHRLSRMLKSIGIRTQNIRLGGQIRKGYKADSFGAAFTRYFSQESVVPVQIADNSESSNDGVKCADKPVERRARMSPPSPTPTVDVLSAEIQRDFGTPLSTVQRALEASRDSRMARLLEVTLDPENRRLTLSALCKKSASTVTQSARRGRTTTSISEWRSCWNTFPTSCGTSPRMRGPGESLAPSVRGRKRSRTARGTGRNALSVAAKVRFLSPEITKRGTWFSRPRSDRQANTADRNSAELRRCSTLDGGDGARSPETPIGGYRNPEARQVRRNGLVSVMDFPLSQILLQ